MEMSMFSFFRSEPLPAYNVTVFLSGKHPYRDEPEFQFKSRFVQYTVQAKSWNKAAAAAMALVENERDYWAAMVDKIEFVGL
jgi:lipopolysaccharide biosynthesis glycosyltransferase